MKTRYLVTLLIVICLTPLSANAQDTARIGATRSADSPKKHDSAPHYHLSFSEASGQCLIGALTWNATVIGIGGTFLYRHSTGNFSEVFWPAIGETCAFVTTPIAVNIGSDYMGLTKGSNGLSYLGSGLGLFATLGIHIAYGDRFPLLRMISTSVAVSLLTTFFHDIPYLFGTDGVNY